MPAAQSTSIPSPATASPTLDQIKPPPPSPPPPPPPPLQLHNKTINNTTTTTIKQPSTPPPLRLDGKVAIVTGGAGGIGSAIVHLFAKHGAKVIIADINNHTATTLLSTPPLNNHPSITYIHCDVTNESSVKSLIDKTISFHGKLDILINNAAILTHHHHNNNNTSILNFDPNEFDRIMNVNLKGVALCMKHAARAMINTNTTTSGCNIVSIASVAGIMGGLGPHGYTVSKHGVIGLTKNAGCELGKYGIRVNCVSPFGVATPMLVNAWRGDEEEEGDDNDGVEKMEEFVRGIANLKRVTLKASDVAEAVLYLVSDEAKYVSGHNLVVDGGFTTCNNIVGL